METPEFIKSAQDLFAKGRTAACLKLLLENVKDSDLYYEILELKNRNSNLETRRNKGLINEADATLEQNQINNGTLQLIKTIEFKPNEALTKSTSNNAKIAAATPTTETIPSTEKKFNLWMFILGGFLLLGAVTGIFMLTRSDATPTPSTAASTTTTTDLCKNVNCGAHGDCHDGHCHCKDGYTGERCNIPPPTKPADNPPIVDPCANIDCGANGKCVNGGCQCKEGYSGDRCQNAPTHTVRISGKLFGLDHDDIGSNEQGQEKINNSFTIKRGESKPTFTLVTLCVDDELYGVVKADATCDANGTVKFNSHVELFEEESCPNYDLDGSEDYSLSINSNSQNNLPTKKIWNKDEGDDYLEYTISVKNKMN